MRPINPGRNKAEPRARLEELRQGIHQFNEGRFFEAHESWEEVWLNSPEPERTFLQGIIQIAAAFHHYGRGNTRGARSLLEAGGRRLAHLPDTYHGLVLDPLRSSAREWACALAEGRDPGPARLPQILIAEPSGPS
jgi:predicted metal-dependent hydrolase